MGTLAETSNPGKSGGANGDVAPGSTPRPRAEYAAGWVDRIPAELRERPQWVCWRFEWRTDKAGAGKWTKVPYQARTLRGRGGKAYRPKAKADVPETWATFAEALAAYQANADRTDSERLDGIGYEFATDDEFAGVDYDDCLTANGELMEWAAGWLDRLGPTYAEVSPSGSGIKAFYRGSLPTKPDGSSGRRRDGYGLDGSGEIEAYDHGRFFTVTGAQWWADQTTIAEPAPGALVDLAAELDAGCKGSRKGSRKGSNGKAPSNGKAEAATSTEPPPVVDPGRKARIDQFSDADLLAWASKAKNGAKFSALYDRGDCSGYRSASQADCALLVMLAYWTGADAARMERLFDGSDLARRSKWSDRPDYRTRSVAAAIELNRGAAADLPDRTASRNDQAEPSRNGTATPADSMARRPRTDLGNAERLVARHGGDLRYCHPWQSWLVWDGRRWKVDDTAEARRRARATARSILAEAAAEPDDKDRGELVKWALASEKRDRLAAMLYLAEAEEGIPILPAEMDMDPWAFNCRNGTIDLRTGRLRPHRRADLITKLCPLDFDPDAECPLWLATLYKFFARPDATLTAKLVDYWYRLCGYAIAGVIRDHVMPVAHGPGGNGKSTILGGLLDVLGPDYAMKATPDFFMAKKNDPHPTDRADLFGKRLVVAIETEAGRRLNETLIKELTGGDRIRARRMREDFWEFAPTHTLIMATNHKPVVRGTDHGIWRRLRLVPFVVKIPDCDDDKGMPDRLRAEAAGILAWCVRGCLEWQRRGLDAPDEVTKATEDYRAEQDLVGTFLDQCVICGPDLKVKAGELYKAYKLWAEDGNEFALTLTRFGEAIRERGIESRKSSCCWYFGIDLNPDRDNPEAPDLETGRL